MAEEHRGAEVEKGLRWAEGVRAHGRRIRKVGERDQRGEAPKSPDAAEARKYE